MKGIAFVLLFALALLPLAKASYLRSSKKVDDDGRDLFVATLNVPFDTLGAPFFSRGGAIATNVGGDVVAVAKQATSNRGVVRVYAFRGTTAMWEPRGNAISVPVQTKKRTDVALNRLGNVLAITSYNNNNNNNNALTATLQLFQLVGGDTWQAMMMDGATSMDLGVQNGFGSPVAMNGDGNIVAFGMVEGGANATGIVKVYEYDSFSSTWMFQTDFAGEHPNDWFGHYVSMNDNGQVIAVGAPLNSGADGQTAYSGHVRVYALDLATGVYKQRGTDIDGQEAFDIASLVSLSHDGNTVAVGSWNRDFVGGWEPIVRVYQYDANDWMPLGRPIEEGMASHPLATVSLSGRGDRVVTSSYGPARLYQLVENVWTPVHETSSDTLAAVLNKNGNRLAVTHLDTGAAEVFQEMVPGRNDPDHDATTYFDASCTEPVPFGYRFFSQQDSPLQNYAIRANQTASMLAALCDANEQCQGFHSDGYLKARIRRKQDFVAAGTVCEGLYVKIPCLPEKHLGTCAQAVPCGYEFVPQRDVLLYTRKILTQTNDVWDYADACDADPECAGFNSDGYTKLSTQHNLVPKYGSDPCLGLYRKMAFSSL